MRLPERWIQSVRGAVAPLPVALGVVAPLPVLAVIIAVFLPLTPSYDVNVFLHAGWSVLHGRHVYPIVGTPAVYSGHSFVYPYFAALPFVPLALLSANLATVLFFALQVAIVLGASLWATEGDPWRTTLVFCTAFTITGLQLGSLSPLLFAGAILAWKLRDRPVAMGLLAAPLVASKLFLLPLLAWPLLARRYRAFAWACSATATLLLVSFAIGPIGAGSYTRLLSVLGLHEARSGFGLTGGLMNAGLGSSAAQASAAAIAAVVLAIAFAHYRRFQNEAIVFCGAIAVALLVTPILWSHYLVLLLAALIALRAPRRSFLMLAAASWVIAPPHGIKVNSQLLESFKNSGPWLTVATLLVMFAAAAVTSRRRTRQSSYG